MCRVLIATVVAAALSLSGAASGSAKGYPLVFDRAKAEPGDTVVASVPGTPAGYLPDPDFSEPGIRVYLVDVADADDVRRFLPVDSRLIDVGIFYGLLGYGGKVTFAAPRVRSGSYTTAVRIRGAFYVTRPSAKKDYGVRGPLVLRIHRSSSDRGGISSVAGIAAATTAAAAVVVLRRRRAGHAPPTRTGGPPGH
jgi:hypothetical protein